MKPWVIMIAAAAGVLFVAAVAGFGSALEGYSQGLHPVGLLGADGIPRALAFNLLGLVAPGLLAAVAAWRFRHHLPDDAPWAARIAGWLALLSALAFAAQGLLPLDPRDVDAAANRAHATAWMLWWVAFLPAALLLAAAQAARRSVLAMASLAAAAIVVCLVALPMELLAPAVAQRVVFVTWFAWFFCLELRRSAEGFAGAHPGETKRYR